jgi:hypothetical protein
MSEQPPPSRRNQVARDGLAAMVIVLIATALIVTVVNHFVS